MVLDARVLIAFPVECLTNLGRMVLYPDELVSQLCEEIAYEKGAVSLAQLWNIAETVMGVTALDDDEPMQRYILQSLFSDPEVLVMDLSLIHI